MTYRWKRCQSRVDGSGHHIDDGVSRVHINNYTHAFYSRHWQRYSEDAVVDV